MAMSFVKAFTIDTQNVCVGPSSADYLSAAADSYDCYSVIDFTLDKEMLKPNELRFTLKHLPVRRSSKAVQFEIAPKLLYTLVHCEVETSLEGKKNIGTNPKIVFDGVIVSCAMQDATISCVARSIDTILDDTLPRCRCFYNKKLETIVKSIWNDQDTELNINPRLKTEIPYVVQYNETDYEFLVRLAKQYGEFFYYDNKQYLVFGQLPAFNPPNNTPIVLKKGKDFLKVEYELWTGNPNFAYVAHHYPEKGVVRPKPISFRTGEKLHKMAVDASTNPVAAGSDLDLYYDYPGQLPVSNADTFLDQQVKAATKTMEANLVTCRCALNRLDVHVGSKIQLTEKATDVDALGIETSNDADNGFMIVIATHMKWDCMGDPVNEITAISYPDNQAAVTDIYPPYTDVNAYPKSTAQRAIVVDNVDPLKLGRVMVRFAWQDVGNPNYNVPTDNTRKDYPWIRIAQPYGGNNKGCYILPEINEEVMVGFEHGNMEKPFVIGTLYHDSATDAEKQVPDENWVEREVNGNKVNKENEVKAFRTKKGHTIEFHDVEGQDHYGFIRIYGNEQQNQPNYDIYLSTDLVQNKVNENQVEEYKMNAAADDATAGEDIKEKEYKASKLRIMVQSHGGDIMLDAGDGDIIMKAANIRVNATGNATTLITGNNIMKVNGAQMIDVDSNSLMVQKKQTVVVKGEDSEEYKEKIQIIADKEINIQAKGEVDIHADKELNFETNKDLNLKSSKAANINAQSLTTNTDKKTEINASDVEVWGRDSNQLRGRDVSVKGTLSTTVKATTITIDAKTGTRKGSWTDM